jgi:hypothetical protein
MKILNSLVVVCIACSFSGLASSADNKYQSTTIFKSDLQTQEWNGEKVTIGTLKGVIQTHASNIPNVPNGDSIQNCTIRGVRKGESFESVSNCTITDKDGDMYFTLAERKNGDLSAGGKGKLRVTGGTGKYFGFSSTCEYAAKYMPENWVVVESDCIKN